MTLRSVKWDHVEHGLLQEARLANLALLQGFGEIQADDPVFVRRHDVPVFDGHLVKGPDPRIPRISLSPIVLTIREAKVVVENIEAFDLECGPSLRSGPRKSPGWTASGTECRTNVLQLHSHVIRRLVAQIQQREITAGQRLRHIPADFRIGNDQFAPGQLLPVLRRQPAVALVLQRIDNPVVDVAQAGGNTRFRLVGLGLYIMKISSERRFFTCSFKALMSNFFVSSPSGRLRQSILLKVSALSAPSLRAFS
jgi:hypothetical protein